MKNLNLFSRFVIKRHYFVVEAENVLEALTVLNSHYSWFVDQKLAVGNCGWAGEDSKWFLHFDASEKHWMDMITDLHERGYELVIKDRPRDIYLVKKTES